MLTLKQYENTIIELKKQRTKDRRKLNKEQRLALDMYFGNLRTGKKHGIGPEINYYLYSDEADDEVDSYDGKYTMSELSKILDCCIENSNAIYKKDLFRGVKGGNSFLDYKIGDRIEFNYFLSTSITPFLALFYTDLSNKDVSDEALCCLLVLKGYKEKVIYCGVADEILLPRNTKWKLTKITIKKLNKNYKGFTHPKFGDYSEHLGVGKTLKILKLEYIDLPFP
jgi:hypothetical protein